MQDKNKTCLQCNIWDKVGERGDRVEGNITADCQMSNMSPYISITLTINWSKNRLNTLSWHVHKEWIEIDMASLSSPLPQYEQHYGINQRAVSIYWSNCLYSRTWAVCFTSLLFNLGVYLCHKSSIDVESSHICSQ